MTLVSVGADARRGEARRGGADYKIEKMPKYRTEVSVCGPASACAR